MVGEVNTHHPLVFYVNNVKIVEQNPDPEETLISYLRRKLHLTGTKLACGEGGCGACTVTVSRLKQQQQQQQQQQQVQQQIQHLAINACLAPLCSMHGLAVTTVEGLGNSKQPHQLQQRLAECHGSQCGFCTPGIVMAASSLLRNCSSPSHADIEEAVQGNLCRCTGYRPVLTALAAFASNSGNINGNSNGSCNGSINGNSNGNCNGSINRNINSNGNSNGNSNSCSSSGLQQEHDKEFIQYDSSKDPEFPQELINLTPELISQNLKFSKDSVTWYRPSSLQSLLKLKRDFPNAKLIGGNTEIGVEQNCQSKRYNSLIHCGAVQELHDLEISDAGIKIGAAVTLTQLQRRLMSELSDSALPKNRRRTMQPFVDCLYWFSSQQIRNVAAIGGNLMTASPISDLNPLLLSCAAKLTFCSSDGSARTVELNDEFFCGYRRVQAADTELLTQILVPWLGQRELLTWAKQSRRRDDDIAIVNCGLRVALADEDDDGECRVEAARLCFGGLAATTRTAKRATAALIGSRWKPQLLLPQLRRELLDEFQLGPGAPGGQAAYRRTLAASLLLQFFAEVDVELRGGEGEGEGESSARGRLQRAACPSSVRIFTEKPLTENDDAVGRPLRAMSSLVQATGEAEFVDDMPAAHGEVFVAPILANRAVGRVAGVDFGAIAEMKGIVGFLTAADVRGCNSYGIIFDDDFVFADSEASFYGDVVAAVVAETREIAMRAARLARPLFLDEASNGGKQASSVVTISDAIEAGSFFPKLERKLILGNADEAMAAAAVRASGEFRIGGQNHFYMEPQSCIVVPRDGGTELTIFSSTQNPTLLQSTVASVTSLARSRVTVKVKRIGGGFGGKENRAVAIASMSALAALKFGRPARCVLDRGSDMSMIGTRHPMLARWQAGADSDGRLVSLKVDAFLNGGHSADISGAVAECIITKCFSAYSVKAVDFRVRVCRTNTPSCTAFRGFGAPQAMALIETVLAELAIALGCSDRQIRQINFIKEGEISPYGQAYTDLTIEQCWNQCVQDSDYERRLQEVRKFNEGSKWKKRGLFIVPLHYGIGFSESAMHQAGALINIYLDGSVLLTHAGVEMGQGIHTKLLQVASHELQVATRNIYIAETSTDKVPNTTSSAASMTTDLNAPAVQDACRQLRKRLAPFLETEPKATWQQAVASAYANGVSLSAVGYFHDPLPNIDEQTMTGHPYIYYTSGAGCSEVEIDVLTGDHVIRRSDIVMDLGNSLNPAIDIGQVEGAFVQGTGLYTLEDLRYSPEGQLRSKGPGAYKIPGFGDIPEQFNVRLLHNSQCKYQRAVYSSKAVGEPPLCLAVSVFMSLRSAVADARRQFCSSGDAGRWSFDAPATSERIRLQCADAVAREQQQQQEATAAAAAAECSEKNSVWEVRLSD